MLKNGGTGIHTEFGYNSLFRSDIEIPKVNRVFNNRNLKMESIRAIGFDMDHTLARYNKENIENLAFRTTLHKLITDRGYDKEIATLEYRPLMAVRGLIVDSELGNILKTDRYKYVNRAYHGEKLIPREERKEIYRTTKIDLNNSRFYSIDTLFGLPEGALWMQLIQFFTDRDIPINFPQLWQDIRSSIDKAHRDGTIKQEILANLEKFFIYDPELPLYLDSLREHRKTLFLLTNSEFFYTAEVMGFILPPDGPSGRNWQDYFDLIVVRSAKPGFFYHDKELERIPVADEDAKYREILIQNNVFRFGNYKSLEALLKCSGDEICYLGDHTFGDIMKSKKVCGWRTIMIIEELAHEITTDLKLAPEKEQLQNAFRHSTDLMRQSSRYIGDINKIHNRKLGEFKKFEPSGLNQLDTELQDLLGKLIECERHISENLTRIQEIELKINQSYNPYWGQIFKAGEELSRFGDQVEDFACIYTYKVSNLLRYPVQFYFHSKRDKMSHELD